MDIKILLADDHKITRDGLKALLESQKNMIVIGEAENGRQAVRLALDLAPDVIVMDINMPELNGIEATRQIISELPDTKIIALSMYSDKRYVVGMLKAGVSGYLLKNCAFDELVSAISAVIANQNYMSQKIADTVMKDYANILESSDASPASQLTAREREVLQLIAEGLKTKDIATQIHVSVKTVETHRQQIMRKLNAKSVAELTKIALREGLTSLDT
ncbi:MAG: response regulator transcription factor [Desulfobacteraceae bacterium]|nr:response regulator transcription factor [Desulfobacteraceae bacterium]MBC2757167.1 response regulator transcription factor [Desulfobacteraceae bacterium]